MAFCGFNLSNNNSLIKLSMNQNLSLSNLFNIFIRPESEHLSTLVSNWLTHWLSGLDSCDPGVWRCQLKTCWWWCCWRWETCWRKFGRDLKAEVWSRYWGCRLCSDFENKVWSWFLSLISEDILQLNFGHYFDVSVWLRLWSWNLIKICAITCNMIWRSYFGKNIQPSGPLFLWQ